MALRIFISVQCRGVITWMPSSVGNLTDHLPKSLLTQIGKQAQKRVISCQKSLLSYKNYVSGIKFLIFPVERVTFSTYLHRAGERTYMLGNRFRAQKGPENLE